MNEILEPSRSNRPRTRTQQIAADFLAALVAVLFASALVWAIIKIWEGIL